jgi:DNA modification methylase
MNEYLNKILLGDVREKLRELPDESVHCVVTSPPYWGLRDYGTATWNGGDASCPHRRRNVRPDHTGRTITGRGVQASAVSATPFNEICGLCGARRIDQQIGLEATPEEYVEKMVGVFREVRRVLRSDGTLWLNIGDSYAGSGRGMNGDGTPRPGLKCKDLVGIPWRLAFALQADGWWLRSDIIWAKPNPMPESVTDRPTKAHEYMFLLTKSERYFYDSEAIKTAARSETTKMPDYDSEAIKTAARSETTKMPDGWNTGEGGHGSFHPNGREKGAKVDKQRGHGRRHDGFNDRWDAMPRAEQIGNGANARTVWWIATEAFPEAHFATYPQKLVERCLLAGSPAEGVVLDPFMGSGTTALVALKAGRKFVGIELNPKYAEMARARIAPELNQLRLV